MWLLSLVQRRTATCRRRQSTLASKLNLRSERETFRASALVIMLLFPELHRSNYTAEATSKRQHHGNECVCQHTNNLSFVQIQARLQASREQYVYLLYLMSYCIIDTVTGSRNRASDRKGRCSQTFSAFSSHICPSLMCILISLFLCNPFHKHRNRHCKAEQCQTAASLQ